MGIFNKLFKKNKANSENKNDELSEIEESINKNLNIDSRETSEMFIHLKDVIVKFLIENLQKINSLEKEIFERSRILKNPKEPNQLQPGEKELWLEFKNRRKNITDLISTGLSEESCSFGKPTKYEYLNYTETKIVFIMKSKNRAVIEIFYEYGTKRKEQFVIKKNENNWSIDSKKYGYQDEEKWYKDNL